MHETSHDKTLQGIKDYWFCQDVRKRVTKLEVKNDSISVSVELDDSEVKDTVAKLLKDFDKTEVIDILTDILKGK